MVNETGPCPIADFGISGVESSGSATTVLESNDTHQHKT
jgi:hypothetical protein